MLLVYAVKTNENQETDEVLMSRFCKGDKDAFRVLYERYQRKIINLLYGFTKEKQQSEDLSQEVFIRMMSLTDRYEAELGKFSAWLNTIAKGVGLNYKKKIKTRNKHLDVQSRVYWEQIAFGRVWSQDRMSRYGEACELLDRVILLMTPNQGRIFFMRHRLDMNNEEISAALNISNSAVRNRLRRARKRVSEYLEGVREEFD